MNENRIVIAYDVSMQYVEDKAKRIFHDYHAWGNEIVIVFDGEGTYHFNEQAFRISKGDFFVLRGDYIKEITDAKQLRLCSIYYREETMRRLAGTFRRLTGYQTLFVQKPLTASYAPRDRLCADEELLGELSKLVDRMLMEHKLREVGYEQIVNSSFFILITLAARAYSAKEEQPFGDDAAFAQTVAFMQTQYTQPLSIPSLAEMAHMSERHFGRKFKEMYQMPPSRYIMQLRLARACALLEETRLSITDIAMECGFSDINYFAKAFKAAYDCSAIQYRKQRLEAVGLSDMERYCLKEITPRKRKKETTDTF